MTEKLADDVASATAETACMVLNAIQHPVIMVDGEGVVCFANWEAESFFAASAAHLGRHKLDTFIPFGSPLLQLIEQVRDRRAAVNEYRVDLSSPRLGNDKLVDLYVAPVAGLPDNVVVVFQERSMADKIDRQLTHRAAARSVTGLASMLAHEIKNPLSGIRGAAQLLEMSVGDDDRALARLIRDETDRIVSLVDRMEIFSDERPVDRVPVNIHSVLDHVKAVAKAGFARRIRFVELYDPSLPSVYANRDQLVQVFLNLVKNAAEAIGDDPNGEIVLTTAYRPGIKLSVAGTREKDLAAARILRAGQRARGAGRSDPAPFRSLHHHQDQWHGAGPRAGCQDRRRPWRDRRVRQPEPQNHLPHSDAGVARRPANQAVAVCQGQDLREQGIRPKGLT